MTTRREAEDAETAEALEWLAQLKDPATAPPVPIDPCERCGGYCTTAEECVISCFIGKSYDWRSGLPIPPDMEE